MKNRFGEEQIVPLLLEAEVPGMPPGISVGRLNLTEQTFFRWRNKYASWMCPMRAGSKSSKAKMPS
ncbi:MAG: hypothetical protein ABI440_13550 [Casimicrobiaceae bacterium]